MVTDSDVVVAVAGLVLMFEMLLLLLLLALGCFAPTTLARFCRSVAVRLCRSQV